MTKTTRVWLEEAASLDEAAYAVIDAWTEKLKGLCLVGVFQMVETPEAVKRQQQALREAEIAARSAREVKERQIRFNRIEDALRNMGVDPDDLKEWLHHEPD